MGKRRHLARKVMGRGKIPPREKTAAELGPSQKELAEIRKRIQRIPFEELGNRIREQRHFMREFPINENLKQKILAEIILIEEAAERRVIKARKKRKVEQMCMELNLKRPGITRERLELLFRNFDRHLSRRGTIETFQI